VLLPDRPPGYRSKRDGNGARAWQNHWLFVPLFDPERHRVGYVWADDPVDRLRPDAERLQILRAFANLAAAALEQAAQLDELQIAYERHRALIDASPVAIIDFDLGGRVRSWNAAATAIFGWAAEEVIGQVSPIVPVEEFGRFLQNIEHIASGKTIRDLDVRRTRRDGTPVDISVSAGPIHDASGTVVGVVSLMVDVTARKRSERALAASEGRKDAVLRAVLDCVVIVDHQGLIAEVNQATEETFGWVRADVLGRPFLELAVAPEHRDAIAQVIDAGSGPLLGTRLELTATRSDGREFAAEVAMTRVSVPGEPLFAVSVRDVTRRRDNEQRLRQAEARYRALVEQLPLTTYINEVGLPLRTTYISPQVETLLGYPVSSWLTEGFLERCLHPEDRERVLAEVERTHAVGDEFSMEYRLVAADGRTVWVRDMTTVVRDSQYRPLLLQGCLIDITDSHASDDVVSHRAA